MSVSGVPHVRAVAHAAAGSAGDEPDAPPPLGGPTGITPPPGEADSVTPPPGTQPAEPGGTGDVGADSTPSEDAGEPATTRGKRPPRLDEALAPTVAPIENAGAGVEWVSGAVIAAILTGLGIGPVDDAVGGAELEVDPGKRPPK